MFPLMMALTGHFVTRAERLRGSSGSGSWWRSEAWRRCSVRMSRGGKRAIAYGATPLAPASVTVSTTLIKRRAARASSLLLNRDSMLIGGVLLLLLAAVFERGVPVKLTGPAISASSTWRCSVAC